MIDGYEWVVFTSANAVERCWRHLSDARALGRTRVAAIGDGTAAALAQRGVVADLLPERFVAESLVADFPHPVQPGSVPCPAAVRRGRTRRAGRRACAPRAGVSRWSRPTGRSGRPGDAGVAEALAGSGRGHVHLLVDGRRASSSSPARRRCPRVVACIGPVTADTARHCGIKVDVVAPVHTVDGLVDALADWARHKSAPAGGR